MRWLALMLALTAVCAATLLLGRDATTGALTFAPGVHGDFVLWQFRLPRLLLGLLTGASLASCGVLFQSTLQNPLASEFTLGTSAGASLGAVGVMTVVGGAAGFAVMAGASFAGAMVVSIPTFVLAARRGIPVEAVVLAGVAISFAAMAMTSAANYLAPETTVFAFTRWTLGSLITVGYGPVLLMALPALVPVVLAWGLRHQLEAMLSGEELALARGVPVRTIRAVTVLAVGVAVGGTVATVGPIGFVGLVVPHMARGLVGGSMLRLTVAAPLLGAVMLAACDVAGRLVIRGADVPIGVMTAALGTPAFIALLWLRFSRREA